MRKITALLGACLLFGMSGVASAYTISTGYTLGDGGYTSVQPGALVNTFDVGSPISFALSPAGNGVLATGSTSGVAAAPSYSGGPDLTTYMKVTGSQTFVVPFLSNYLGLWWGSVDTYNSITFFNGGVATGDVVTGSQVAAPANGSWTNALTNMYVNISSLDSFDSFMLISNSPAFEVDNVAVAPVPEPGTMILLGAGFLGLAVYGKRRRNA